MKSATGPHARKGFASFVAGGRLGTGIVLATLAVGLAPLQASAQELIPAYQRTVLKNGLTLLTLEQHELPLVDFRFLIRTGSTADPAGKEGLADVTMALLRKGTSEHTAEQIAEELDFLGAEFDVAGSLEYCSVSAQFLAKDVESGLALVADMLMRPVFPEEEFQKLVALHVDELREAKDNPRSVIGNYFAGFLFADHPYGRPQGGTETSLPGLLRADVLRFQEAYLRPNNVILAAVGDFDAGKLKGHVESAFGKWERSPITEVQIPAPQPLMGHKVLLVDKPDAVQTYFYIGNVGVAKGNPDEATLDVVNTVFGGRFTSWLMNEMRTKNGLTYNAHSRFVERKLPGPFYISSFTRTEDTEKAVDMALDILERLHEKGLSQEELDSAKNYIRGQFPPDYESSGALARAIAELEFYGLDRSIINDHTQQTDAVTLDDVRRVIAKDYPRENLALVFVGQADSIRTVLAKYGELRAKSISDPGF